MLRAGGGRGAWKPPTSGFSGVECDLWPPVSPGTAPPAGGEAAASWGDLVLKRFSLFFPSRLTTLPMSLGSFQNSLTLPVLAFQDGVSTGTF